MTEDGRGSGEFVDPAGVQPFAEYPERQQELPSAQNEVVIRDIADLCVLEPGPGHTVFQLELELSLEQDLVLELVQEDRCELGRKLVSVVLRAWPVQISHRSVAGQHDIVRGHDPGAA